MSQTRRRCLGLNACVRDNTFPLRVVRALQWKPRHVASQRQRIGVFSSFFVAAACLLVGAPDTAHACSPPPPDGLHVELLSQGPIHRDGALVLYARDYDLDATDIASEMTIEVTLDGETIAGSLEVLDTLGPASSWEHEVIALWRPDAELVAAEGYQLAISFDPGDGNAEQTTEASFTVLDASAPVLEMIAASTAEPEVGQQSSGFGPRICCTQEDSCGERNTCTTESVREELVVRGFFDLGDADPQYVLVRAFSGLAGAADQLRIQLRPGSQLPDGFHASFSDVEGSYCVAFEAVDVLTGTTVNSDVVCVDAPNDLIRAEQATDVDLWAERCLDDPHWEANGQPWTPGSPPPEGDTDGTGQDDDASGCNVAGGGSASWAWLTVLLAAATRRRRRRWTR